MLQNVTEQYINSKKKKKKWKIKTDDALSFCSLTS